MGSSSGDSSGSGGASLSNASINTMVVGNGDQFEQTVVQNVAPVGQNSDWGNGVESVPKVIQWTEEMLAGEVGAREGGVLTM
mmetsp:Transcript_4077/g.15342  ORF Transcript_4077/g.15342 Transcript_4077/m.15342 type:complete len:82 (+) Transcript_4077:5235-5480(+)